MIPRYETKPMREIWEENAKFQLWLDLELAVLDARVKLGRLEPRIAERIRQGAKFDITRIDEIEKENEHDLLAFVQCVRENLEPDLCRYFHEDMTSYDSQEIPMNLRLRESLKVLKDAIDVLIGYLRSLAQSHKCTLMIGRTHGQHAQPITFGFKVLGWLDIFNRDRDRLERAQGVISVGKLSGAVGVYGGLDPGLEQVVCEAFGFQPVRHSTQIIHRDRIAEVMSAVAILVSNIEYVVTSIRLLAQTEIREVLEPMKKKQQGSSAMPHKRNPILCERLGGIARVVRNNLQCLMENIATWNERDISHSSVERIVLADCFHGAHYILSKLISIIKGLEVNTEQMKENLAMTFGCIHSEEVKTLLCSWGIEPAEVYQLLQTCAFEAMKTKRHFSMVIRERALQYFTSEARILEFNGCFNDNRCLQHIDKIFARFGLKE